MNPFEYPGGRTIPAPPDLLDRMVRAVEKVRERLHRSTAALERAGVPYAVVGGNAVAAWVARVDEAAVRFTPDVDILLDRTDLQAATRGLAEAGFWPHAEDGIIRFLDGPNAKARDAVRIYMAGEGLCQDDPTPAPHVDESEQVDAFQVIGLVPLVRMELTSYRRVSRLHVRDMIDVGLVDESWLPSLPEPLADRLRTLLEDPEG